MVASSKMLLLQFSRIAVVLSLYQSPILASPLPPPLAHSPAQLDLTVTVLTDNDLEAQDTLRTTRALLIESTQSATMAPGACAAFHETLWSPDTEDFNLGLNNTLSYQVYLKKFPKDQLFWVKSTQPCTAINYKGVKKTENCHKRLPVLCTNSAPLPTMEFVDKSEPWRVSKRVGGGVLTGFRDQNSFAFFGVRYSEDPGRFRHSSPYRVPNGASLSALEYGNTCLQNPEMTGTLLGAEDCFFLNIWTPYLPGKAASPKNLKPVAVWIHGGGLLFGSGNDPENEGGNVASRGDIVNVFVNFRLGTLGWGSFNDDIRGNFGLGDMTTVLKWIKANIKSLGGDPSQVTIAGQSGGAGGVRAVIATEKNKGILHGAIMQSGPFGTAPQRVYSEFYTSEQSAADRGAYIANKVGCTNPANLTECLRALPGSAFPLAGAVDEPRSYVHYPFIDNDFLFDDLKIGSRGKNGGYVANIPIMTGIDRDEVAVMYAAMYGAPAADILNFFGDLVLGPVNSVGYLNHPAFQYTPTGDFAYDNFKVANDIISGYGFSCLTWSTAYSLSKVVPAVYAYNFNRTYQPQGFNAPICNPPITAEHPLGDFDQEYFKCHAGEVPVAFGLIKYEGLPDRDGKDIRFSQLATDHWAAFSRTGDPNPDPDWLKARGYWSTWERMVKAGRWEKIGASDHDVRVIQWDSHNDVYTQQAQCNAMDQPIDHYE